MTPELISVLADLDPETDPDALVCFFSHRDMLLAAAKREAVLREEVEALRKALAEGAEGAFLAHMEERNKREAAEASRDAWKAMALTKVDEQDRLRAVAEEAEAERDRLRDDLRLCSETYCESARLLQQKLKAAEARAGVVVSRKDIAGKMNATEDRMVKVAIVMSICQVLEEAGVTVTD